MYNHVLLMKIKICSYCQILKKKKSYIDYENLKSSTLILKNDNGISLLIINFNLILIIKIKRKWYLNCKT